jgi:MFS family permease
MIKKQTNFRSPTTLVSTTAIVIALTIMGDSLMYSLLPLEAESLGIPIAYVGLLLSINRIVRLGSNTWAGVLYEKMGPRRPFILACLIAIFTTLIYGLGWGLGAFIIARAGWGLAWSLFRQGGYIAIWAADGSARGKLTGLLWGIVRLGSAVSVILGGFLYDKYGFSAAILSIVGLTTLSIPIALKLPWPNNENNKVEGLKIENHRSWKNIVQEKSHKWLLVVGFSSAFFDSIIVSTASLFLAENLSNNLETFGLSIGTMAGFLLGLRFSANIIFGPIIGAFSDKYGQARTLSWLSLLVLLGTYGAILLNNFWVPLSIALVFISTSGIYVAGNASASKEGEHTNRPNIFIGFYNTAIDAGSALGPLFVYSSAFILQSLGWIYIASGVVLFLIIQRYFTIDKNSFIITP